MTIEFKVCVSEPNVIDKTLVSVMTLEGTLRNDSPISNPSILVETNGLSVGDLVRANYAYIPEFGRYYYLKEVTHLRNMLWTVDMKCDVLMSFADGIKASTALIEETTTPGVERVNDYVRNDSYQTLLKDKTDIIDFPVGFVDDPYFILITAGGIVS